MLNPISITLDVSDGTRQLFERLITALEAVGDGVPATTQNDTFTPPPGAPAVDVKLDGRGYPWDARIHSSSRAQLAKPPHGWKPLRGVDPALVELVEAEWRALRTGTPPATAAAVQAEAPAIDPAVAFPTLQPGESASLFADTPPPVAPPAPVAPAAPPATFAELMGRVASAGKMEQATAAAVELGAQSLALVATRPELWAPLAAKVGV